MNPLIHAALVHLDFVKIHPFADGNERTARLLMSSMLHRSGYPAIPIYPSDRAAYIHTIGEADTDQGDSFTALIVRLEAETIEALLGAQGVSE